MKHLILILIFLVVGCTSLKNTDDSGPNTEIYVGIKNGNLIYQGRITEASNNAIFSLFNDAEFKPRRLVISTNGGEIGAGIDLGRWVKHNKLDVEVEGVCASSCANYVFPAANTKYLRKDSILIWHGSAWQSNWHVDQEQRETFNTYISLIRKKETDFYADIRVDNLLTTYGQSKANFWDYLLNFFGKETVGYDYSLADLQKFGLANIVLLDEEWDWRKYRPDRANLVKRIKVGDDYEFELNRFEI
ncbi:hypothetical protein GCM10010919_22920 [Alishewanella longhuensis]|uniref:Alpha/beta hydrolase n=1 Tax=Alishewanella longhuensis TaxID=1091037 RepID=A0ABQ3L7Z5_9ALTE|nr:hypothetical protein [Alishewanella longhuensis]GHG71528.1 hypothetical protein GCM10010919_22920 [Alishewanella longhuensis]